MSWNGIKKHTNNAEIVAWCEEMDIENYTINSQGEIDVDGSVNLGNKDIKELPYKFGTITGYFNIGGNPNLISLKNCPDYVDSHFRCSYCPQLDSLEGCPKEVNDNFFCKNCKRKFTEEEVYKLCKTPRVYNKL